MRSKDYYKILEVIPTAKEEDIKKSYRRLAMKYHPDKNFNNKFSEIKFKEIQEAYNILSNPKKRESYNHLRFDETHKLYKKPSSDLPSPQAILQKATVLRKKVATLDPHRIDLDTLYYKIQMILSAHNMNVLKTFNEEQANRAIIEELLIASKHLQMAHTKLVCMQLLILAGNDTELKKKIYAFQKHQQLHSYWNNYHIIAAILVAAIFCFTIYKLGV